MVERDIDVDRTLRFVKMYKPRDIFSTFDHPTKINFNSLSKIKKKNLVLSGRKYLNLRLNGNVNDIAGNLAYTKLKSKINKQIICKELRWDIRKKIFGFYASNWYDWPHQVGMKNFQDFYDWVKVTLKIAENMENVNWLFKALIV